MRDLTTFDNMFRDLTRFAVGFEPTFKQFDYFGRDGNVFPPYNIEKLDDTHFTLNMAVAGYTTDDIEILLQDNILTVNGNNINDQSGNKNYLFKGISNRSFKRSFVLNDGIEVTGCDLTNGILTVDFTMIQPEITKPKIIPIGSKLNPTIIDGK